MNLVIKEKELKHLPITTDPEIMSGAPVFKGTRVPIDALLNNLEAGLTLDEFLDNFPTVTREQALQVLEFSKPTFLLTICLAFCIIGLTCFCGLITTFPR